MATNTSTIRLFAVLAIALMGLFFPDIPVSSISRSLAAITTDEELLPRSLVSMSHGECKNCRLPDYLSHFSLITEADAAISLQAMYKGIAVGGYLTDSSPSTSTMISSGYQAPSYIQKTSGRLNIQFNGPKYNATLQDAGTNFEELRCIANRAKTAKMGEYYHVMVKTSGGTFTALDFSKGVANGAGKTILVFHTNETVILDLTMNGSFGPDVFAPFSRVKVPGSSTGFVDGLIVAKSCEAPSSASSVQLQSTLYEGDIVCVEDPTLAPIVAPKGDELQQMFPAPIVPLPTPPQHSMDGGAVNGDPLIVGLSGQLFHFDGRNGAWYSAVSTPSFQWNLRVKQYELCPGGSSNFVSGAGFTWFDKANSTTIVKSIEATVTNAYNVDVGCGHDGKTENSCLGAGSLELIIDGVKHVVGEDYMTSDGFARVTTFNTFHQCSRRWYDFHMDDETSGLCAHGRHL